MLKMTVFPDGQIQQIKSEFYSNIDVSTTSTIDLNALQDIAKNIFSLNHQIVSLEIIVLDITFPGFVYYYLAIS